MKKILVMTLIAGLGLSGLTGCNDGAKKGAETDFQYSIDQFADIEVLRYRIPGWGMIRWQEIYRILYDINYTGPMIIEHEDPVFDGPLREQGLKMGLSYLRQFDIPE